MRKLLLTAGVLAMSVATANAAKPGENRGGGARAEQSQGRGHGGQSGRAENRRDGNDRARRGGERREMRAAQREDRRENRAERRGNRGEQRADRREDRRERRAERRDDRREFRAERRDNRFERGDDRRDRREGRAERRDDRFDRGQRRAQRRAVVLRDSRQVQRLRFDRGVGLIDGCPPGLARRNNGCMPPGQLRQRTRAWYSNWWDRRDDAADFVYDDGYLYRLAPSGAVAGFVPLLGGALWPGQTWPTSYSAYDVPDYYVDYYGFDDPYDYRLADGVIYGLDPQTQAIQSILALVTDNDWQIGQQMPDGYGVYNVPYAYRDQYFDTADSWYRYDDGYVYQVDPTTQLIQAAIQLIT